METASTHKVTAAGLLITLGIVYGDIGTSPLYVIKAIMGDQEISETLILGGLSCVFWTLTIQTTLKYVLLTLQADNQGEGGIIALYALVRRKAPWLMIPAIIGTSALLADGLITPPISVTSAIEGLELIEKNIPVVPIVLFIITCLFIFQQFGTKIVGRAFGPIMLFWFSMLAVLGLWQVIRFPVVLKAVNPYYAYQLLVQYPGGFWLLGAVFLCTTGAEALYSDLGHVGRKNIQMSWIFVKTALLLNYFGQGAWLLNHLGQVLSQEKGNPFYKIMPDWFVIPGIITATAATVIASQALISGSYTLVQEAMQLRLWPKMKILYPTAVKGQLYLPGINWMLFTGCVGIVLFFRKSENIEAAYGLTITITMLMTTLLLVNYLRIKETPVLLIALCTILFLTVELSFLYANSDKIAEGAWVTLTITAILSVTMWAWRKGTVITRRYVKYVHLQKYHDMFRDLTKDESVPKYATNLVYLSDASTSDDIEYKVTYSIFNKRPKRADLYWILHVRYVDEPFTKNYRVEHLIPGLLIRIEFILGFRVEPRINMFLRNVVKELEDNHEIEMVSRHDSMKKYNIPGDFRFVIIENILTYDYDLPFFQEVIMDLYDKIKLIGQTEKQAFELDTSIVTVEKVPLIISKTIDENLVRIE